LMTLIPAGFAALSVFVVRFYALSETKVLEIQSDLAERKSAQVAIQES